MYLATAVLLNDMMRLLLNIVAFIHSINGVAYVFICQIWKELCNAPFFNRINLFGG